MCNENNSTSSVKKADSCYHVNSRVNKLQLDNKLAMQKIVHGITAILIGVINKKWTRVLG